MAIKVNGTTVIDDSRNLSNVGGLKTVGGASVLGSGDIATGGSTTAGDVGTYALLRFGGDIGTVGSTHSGSSLSYCCDTDSAGNNIIISYSGTPSGTWRLMGHGNGGFSNDKSSVFVRIS